MQVPTNICASTNCNC